MTLNGKVWISQIWQNHAHIFICTVRRWQSTFLWVHSGCLISFKKSQPAAYKSLIRHNTANSRLIQYYVVYLTTFLQKQILMRVLFPVESSFRGKSQVQNAKKKKNHLSTQR